MLVEAVMWNTANASGCEGTEARGIGEARSAGKPCSVIAPPFHHCVKAVSHQPCHCETSLDRSSQHLRHRDVALRVLRVGGNRA